VTQPDVNAPVRLLGAGTNAPPDTNAPRVAQFRPVMFPASRAGRCGDTSGRTRVRSTAGTGTAVDAESSPGAFLPGDYISLRIDAMDLENRLRDTQTDRRDRLHGQLLRIVGA
jgi:hypothetical protein